VKVGIPKEIFPGEKRVAATPASVSRLRKLGHTVQVQAGAGEGANIPDAAFAEAGATVVPTAEALYADAELVLKIRAPEPLPDGKRHEVDLFKEGAALVSFIWPAQHKDLIEKLATRKLTVMALDAVPRITRAQKMDVLSSMANIAGYRAVVEAANAYGRFFGAQVTAAGTLRPARVLIIGAGVAGLAALGAAKALGAEVRAFDTRSAAREQVESLGGRFLEVQLKESGEGQGGYAKVMSPEFIAAEMALFEEQAKEVDVVITTALIPGKPAPKLWLKDMVESMRAGSVVFDLAAEQGGNCDLTVPGEVIEHSGVTIIGYTDLPSRLPTQSSQLYATNLAHLLTELTPGNDGKPVVDMDDDVIRGATVIHEGKLTWPPPPPKVPVPVPAPAAVAAVAPVAKPRKPPPVAVAAKAKEDSGPIKVSSAVLILSLAAIGLVAIGGNAPPVFMQHLTVFVLACFLGFHVIWNVTPALHTPLMSVTNAISGIIVIGALLQIGSASWFVKALAAISVLIATINICGGFWVTHRMLRMFRRDV